MSERPIFFVIRHFDAGILLTDYTGESRVVPHGTVPDDGTIWISVEDRISHARRRLPRQIKSVEYFGDSMAGYASLLSCSGDDDMTVIARMAERIFRLACFKLGVRESDMFLAASRSWSFAAAISGLRTRAGIFFDCDDLAGILREMRRSSIQSKSRPGVGYQKILVEPHVLISGISKTIPCGVFREIDFVRNKVSVEWLVSNGYPFIFEVTFERVNMFLKQILGGSFFNSSRLISETEYGELSKYAKININRCFIADRHDRISIPRIGKPDVLSLSSGVFYNCLIDSFLAYGGTGEDDVSNEIRRFWVSGSIRAFMIDMSFKAKGAGIDVASFDNSGIMVRKPSDPELFFERIWRLNCEMTE